MSESDSPNAESDEPQTAEELCQQDRVVLQEMADEDTVMGAAARAALRAGRDDD